MDKPEEQYDYKELVREATEQAKKNLEGIIKPNQLGYQGFLEDEIRKILREKGIEWRKENKGVSTD